MKQQRRVAFKVPLLRAALFITQGINTDICSRSHECEGGAAYA